MATQFNQETDEERQRRLEQEGEPTATGGGLIGTGVSPTPDQPTKPTSSGQYTNFQAYVDANQDQAGELGNKVAGYVNKEADDLANYAANADRDFKGQVDQNRVSYDQGLADRASNNPTSVVGDKDALWNFSRMRDASYGGPSSLADTDLYQPLQKEKQEADDAAKLSATEEGRQSILGNQFGRSDYGQGMRLLDNLLLQNGSGNRERFDAAREKTNQADKSYDDILASLPQYAQQAKDETAATKQKTYDAFLGPNGALPTLQNTVQTRATDLKNQKGAEYNDLVDELKRRTLTSDASQKYGLAAGEHTYGVDPLSYLQTNADPTAASAASKDEQAKYAALSELMGQENTFLPFADQAGSYDPASANAFNSENFHNAVAAQKAAYDNEANNVKYTFASDGAKLPLPEAVERARQTAEWAKTYADPKTGTIPSTFQPYISEYNNLKSQLDAIQQKYGYNDTFNVSDALNLSSNPALRITYKR
jgi:hypothetical protein